MLIPWKTIRSLLFRLDAEDAHSLAIKYLKILSKALPATSPNISSPVEVFGVQFPNPLGLAAGFDKDGEAILAWQRLGFGFVEAGTVTAHPQQGNPRPRLTRIPEHYALKNCMGFNNAGAKALGIKLQKLRDKEIVNIPIGINIGKSKIVSNEEVIQDYCKSFSYIKDVADYVAINISSPNTPSLRDLQTANMIKKIMDALMELNRKQVPILIKLSPDLDDDTLISCAIGAIDCGAQGLILANTSTSTGLMPNMSGGVSGQPIRERANSTIKLIRTAVSDKIPLIGVGGIIDHNDANERIKSGATLIQAYTGFVYGGPSFAKDIIRQLDI
jgi:dihydroorotate dehydrogenase